MKNLSSLWSAITHFCDRLLRALTPAEFAIEPPVLPASWTSRLESLLKEQAPAGEPAPPKEFEDALRTIGELAVFVWRMQQRLAVTDPPPDRKITQAVQRMAAQLEDLGVVIRDYAGKRFNPGLAIDVRAYQPTASVTEETVTETLRPAVFFQSHHIVRSDVVVSIPQDNPSSASS